jgi:hypothetical protein
LDSYLYDFEQRRTPKQLCDFVEAVKEWVNQNELKNGILRTEGKYKYFVDEIIPLSRYCIATFDESFEILPVIGNQGYDAEVYQNNFHLFNIEIVYPHDGIERARDAMKFIKTGIGGFKISKPTLLHKQFDIIRAACESKSKKDYSDSVLLFNIKTGAVHPDQEKSFDLVMGEVVQLINGFKFKAKRVAILFNPFGRVVELKT